MFRTLVASIAIALGLGGWRTAADEVPGVVVEEVLAGQAATQAGIQPGDILLSWRRSASPPANPQPASGALRSPLELEEVEVEQAPRGEVVIRGTRHGEDLAVRLPPGRWGLTTRPSLNPHRLAMYVQGRSWDPVQGAEGWRRLAQDLRQAGEWRQASSLYLRIAHRESEAERFEEAEAAFGEALRAATAGGDGGARGLILDSLAGFLARREEWDRAAATYHAAIAAREDLGAESLAVARSHFLLGRLIGARGDFDGADEQLRRALAIGERLAPDSLAVADIYHQLGYRWAERRESAQGEDDLRRALEIRQRRLPNSLDVAHSLHALGNVAMGRGDLQGAEKTLLQALAIKQRLAADSGTLATSFSSLGQVAVHRADLDPAEERYLKALELSRRVDPESLQVSNVLEGLSVVAGKRRDLVAAERYARQSLAIRERLLPDSIRVASSLGNLGIICAIRGDLARAEDYTHRALTILQRLVPNSPFIGSQWTTLGDLAWQRGDLVAAEDYFGKALALQERIAPASYMVARALQNLAWVALQGDRVAQAETLARRALEINVALDPASAAVANSLSHLGVVATRRGRLEAAEGYLVRALDLYQKLRPGSLLLAEVSLQLGHVDLAQGNLAEAEARYRGALTIWQEQAPGSHTEADICHSLGTLYRRRELPDQALEFFSCALGALDAQTARLGGTDELRAGFAAKYAGYYRDTLEMLIAGDQPAAAYHVLERYRARSFLALLAERDLVLAGDIPAELADQRRHTNLEYDRLSDQLRQASADGGERQELRLKLRELRRDQAEIERKIRVASPRLASLEYPQPLDLAATHQILDPGTLLLSYAIGGDKSHLFAIGPGPEEFAVFALEVSRETLQREVRDFRRLMRPTQAETTVRFRARRLGHKLLAPVSSQIAAARRVVLIADGALHGLPFAALVLPGTDPETYLVEAKPVSVVASATVLGELKKRRPPVNGPGERTREWRISAFGDPAYPQSAAAPEAVEPRLRSALRSGLDLEALPHTRTEVENLTHLFPNAPEVFLGPAAREEEAKSLDTEASIVHFACHGLIDESSPLDSALALSIPPSWQEGQENGLLQAWEIFEQLRLDAELVTLSACDTGLGKELAAEGILGLTRAFQYAGARSVLSSLWEVADRGTAELMRRFYVYLQQGKSKSEALRQAQLDFIRGARGPASDSLPSEPHHPFFWAAFQLTGDWQ